MMYVIAAMTGRAMAAMDIAIPARPDLLLPIARAAIPKIIQRGSMMMDISNRNSMPKSPVMGTR